MQQELDIQHNQGICILCEKERGKKISDAVVQDKRPFPVSICFSEQHLLL